MKIYFIVKSSLQSAMLLILIAVLNGISIRGISQTGISYSSYYQEIKSDIQLPEIAGKRSP